MKKKTTAMKFKKSSPGSVSFMESVMEAVDCEKRQMFGYPAYFINGNMFTGLFADDLFFRVDPEKRETFSNEVPGCKQFEPVQGRPMKEYLSLPNAQNEKKPLVKKLVDEALKYASSLPKKKKK